MLRPFRLVLACTVALSALASVRSADAETLIDVRVTMDDGVRLAADVYIPTIADRDGDGRYPCVVELTPYRKEMRAAEGASYLPGQGIVLIEVDARGTGGSEGEYDIVFSVREQADAAAMIEWAATTARKPNGDPLCEETVGMYGGSYSGIIQYLVASLPAVAGDDLPAAPPHLAAIAPQRAYGDLYRDIVYHGGMAIGSFGLAWSSATTALYTDPPSDVAGPDGQSAWLDHLTMNDPMMLNYFDNPTIDARFTSDDTVPAYSQDLYEDSSVLPRIENLTVPSLHLAGWFDAFTRGQVLTFQKAHELEVAHGDRGPNLLIVGPWNHTGTHFITPDHGLKPLLASWYHHWLEDAGDGVAEPDWGAAVRYFQMRTATVNAEASTDGTWMTADSWPPQRSVRSFDVAFDGLLPAPIGTASYVSGNPTSGVGEVASRWDNAVPAMPNPQIDQRVEQGRGLTWSSPVLSEDVDVAGPISMSFHAAIGSLGPEEVNDQPTPGIEGAGADVGRGGPDTDFIVKISEVTPDGSVRLVTQGYLRASHRSIDPEESEWFDDTLLRPFHRHDRASVESSPDDCCFTIEIWPTAKTFRAGHQIRVDLYGADTPNHLTIARPSVVTVWGAELNLPIR